MLNKHKIELSKQSLYDNRLVGRLLHYGGGLLKKAVLCCLLSLGTLYTSSLYFTKAELGAASEK